ncbi:MAG: hypothetical protein CL816_04825 [Coxiellaceae bacterium]|nr:hypothetical protein [Coxiellaceae bacterium]
MPELNTKNHPDSDLHTRIKDIFDRALEILNSQYPEGWIKAYDQKYPDGQIQTKITLCQESLEQEDHPCIETSIKAVKSFVTQLDGLLQNTKAITITLICAMQAQSVFKSLNPWRWYRYGQNLDQFYLINLPEINLIKSALQDAEKQLDERNQERYSHRPAFCDATDVRKDANDACLRENNAGETSSVTASASTNDNESDINRMNQLGGGSS